MAEGTFRGWVPECYFDEVVPEPRATPSAWLLPGEVMRLAGFDAHDDPGPVIAEGETATFFSLTDYGVLRIDWKGGRDFVAIDPVPAGPETYMLLGDVDTISDSVAELCGTLADSEWEPGVLGVKAYTWCDGKAFVMRNGAFVEAVS